MVLEKSWRQVGRSRAPPTKADRSVEAPVQAPQGQGGKKRTGRQMGGENVFKAIIVPAFIYSGNYEGEGVG